VCEKDGAKLTQKVLAWALTGCLFSISKNLSCMNEEAFNREAHARNIEIKCQEKIKYLF